VLTAFGGVDFTEADAVEFGDCMAHMLCGVDAGWFSIWVREDGEISLTDPNGDGGSAG
jgi:hypothetical protein